MSAAEHGEDRMLAILTGRIRPFAVSPAVITTNPTSTAPDLEWMVEGWNKLIAEVQPPPFWASSRNLPREHAISFKVGGTDYLGAHPDFWAKVPSDITRPWNPFARIEVFDLDIDPRRSTEFWAAFRAAADQAKEPK